MKIIKKEKILQEVISYIQKAKKEICMTMKFDDDVIIIPQVYFDILDQKLLEGVKIKRLCFGGVKEFGRFTNEKIPHGEYVCKLTKSKEYKRMIIIDKKYLFYKSKQAFVFSDNKQRIEEYSQYFISKWNI